MKIKALYLLMFCRMFGSLHSYAQKLDIRENPSASFVQAENFSIVKSPLLFVNKEYSSSLTYYSYFLKRLPDYKGGMVAFQRDTASNTKIGVRVINLPLITIIAHAYQTNEINYRQGNRILFETSQKEFLVPPRKDFPELINYKKWILENTWCYELKVKASQGKNLYQIMREDLKRYFNLIGNVEKKKVSCLVVIRTGNSDLLKTSNPAAKPTASIGKDGLIVVNSKISEFVQFIQNQNGDLNTPIVDGTNYSGSIDLKLKINFRDITQLKSALIPYGLGLVEQERDIDMIVIKEAN